MNPIAPPAQHHLVMAEGTDRQVLVLLDHKPDPSELNGIIPGCNAARIQALTPSEYAFFLRLVPELVR